VHGEGGGVHHADNAVSQRKHALRMKILADNLLNELVHVPGRPVSVEVLGAARAAFLHAARSRSILPSSRWTKPLRANSGAQEKRPRNEGILQGHAGKTVADRHYIAKNLKRFHEAVCRLPLPTTLPWLPSERPSQTRSDHQARCKPASNDQLNPSHRARSSLAQRKKKLLSLSTQTA